MPPRPTGTPDAARAPRCRAADRTSPTVVPGRAPACKLLADLPRCPRVTEGGRADLNGVGAGLEKFERVASAGDPTHADDGHVGKRGPALPDRPYRNRMDGGAREATSAGAEQRPAGLWIERQAQQRVDQRQGLRATLTAPAAISTTSGTFGLSLAQRGNRHAVAAITRDVASAE